MRWLEEQRDPNHPHICTIERVVDETPTVRTLYFHDEVLANVKPGQFAMVWIPGVNELPMSVMISEKKDEAGFTVRKRGESSTALYNLKVGDKIGVRGPYGNSFDYRDPNGIRLENHRKSPFKDILLIGGGTGLVPLLRLQKYWMQDVLGHPHITLLMGSKTKDEVFFEDIAKKILSVEETDFTTIPMAESLIDNMRSEKNISKEKLEHVNDIDAYIADIRKTYEKTL